MRKVRDGGLSVAEDPFSGRRIQPFSQGSQYHGDLLGGGFQPVQGRVASGTEGAVAGLTTKGLDAFGLAMLAIANQRVEVSICDPEVRALSVGTGEAFGGYPLGSSTPAFHLTPGANRPGAGPTPNEGVVARRQTGQSSGVRGLSRRCTVVRTAPVLKWEGWRGSQP